MRHFSYCLADVVLFYPMVQLTVGHVDLEFSSGIQGPHFVDHLTEIRVALSLFIKLVSDGNI